MIVCVCAGVSDREIRAAIQAGARTLGDLGRRCRAGVDCGACRDMLRGMLGAGCHHRPAEAAATTKTGT